MTKLRLATIEDEKPVRLTVDLPAALYRDLVAYAEIMARQDNLSEPYPPARLVAPMLARFMQADRGFRRLRNGQTREGGRSGTPSA
ncbi:DUF2274 domain-containing protein [Komagataeibacter oboediens]